MIATTRPPESEQPSPALRLRPPEHRVDPRAVRYWTVRALAGWLLLLTLQAVLLVFAVPAGLRTLGSAVPALTLPLSAAHLTVMPRLRYRTHRWETTDGAIYTQTGWLVEERRIAPIARVQTVDHERGPFERLFGLTNITVTTASSAGPLRIRGLAEETAARVAAELTLAARSGAGDAT